MGIREQEEMMRERGFGEMRRWGDKGEGWVTFEIEQTNNITTRTIYKLKSLIDMEDNLSFRFV